MVGKTAQQRMPRLDLRKAARGQQCLVWISPHCRAPSTATTVLAHIRRAGVAGIGQKPPDLCGVYACDHCHSVIDGREKLPPPGLTRLELDQAILFALLRTLALVNKQLGVKDGG